MEAGDGLIFRLNTYKNPVKNWWGFFIVWRAWKDYRLLPCRRPFGLAIAREKSFLTIFSNHVTNNSCQSNEQ